MYFAITQCILLGLGFVHNLLFYLVSRFPYVQPLHFIHECYIRKEEEYIILGENK